MGFGTRIGGLGPALILAAGCMAARPTVALADTVEPPWYDEPSTLAIVVVAAVVVAVGIATALLVLRRRRRADEQPEAGPDRGEPSAPGDRDEADR